jgi:hypothetical protein
MAKQPRGATHLKGLGQRHRQQRERLLRLHVEGSPCQLCGEPMLKSSQRLQADHSIPRAIAGPHGLADRLVHAACNARAGAILGNQLNGRSHSGLSEPNRTNLAMPWPP